MVPLEFPPLRHRLPGVLTAFKKPTVRKRSRRAVNRSHAEIGTVPGTDSRSLAACAAYFQSRPSQRAYGEFENFGRALSLIHRPQLALQAGFRVTCREEHPEPAIDSVENRVNKWRILG